MKYPGQRRRRARRCIARARIGIRNGGGKVFIALKVWCGALAAHTMSDPVVPTAIDYLDEDVIKVNGQNYALISFVTKEGKQRTDGDSIALKIRGCFESKDAANAHLKRLMANDKSFDIYLVETGKWLCIPPPGDIDDVVYQEKYLNDMIYQYRSSQQQAKEHFAERKASIIAEGLDKHLLPHERLPEPDVGAGPSV